MVALFRDDFDSYAFIQDSRDYGIPYYFEPSLREQGAEIERSFVSKPGKVTGVEALVCGKIEKMDQSGEILTIDKIVIMRKVDMKPLLNKHYQGFFDLK